MQELSHWIVCGIITCLLVAAVAVGISFGAGNFMGDANNRDIQALLNANTSVATGMSTRARLNTTSTIPSRSFTVVSTVVATRSSAPTTTTATTSTTQLPTTSPTLSPTDVVHPTMFTVVTTQSSPPPPPPPSLTPLFSASPTEITPTSASASVSVALFVSTTERSNTTLDASSQNNTGDVTVLISTIIAPVAGLVIIVILVVVIICQRRRRTNAHTIVNTNANTNTNINTNTNANFSTNTNTDTDTHTHTAKVTSQQQHAPNTTALAPTATVLKHKKHQRSTPAPRLPLTMTEHDVCVVGGVVGGVDVDVSCVDGDDAIHRVTNDVDINTGGDDFDTTPTHVKLKRRGHVRSVSDVVTPDLDYQQHQEQHQQHHHHHQHQQHQQQLQQQPHRHKHKQNQPHHHKRKQHQQHQQPQQKVLSVPYKESPSYHTPQPTRSLQQPPPPPPPPPPQQQQHQRQYHQYTPLHQHHQQSHPHPHHQQHQHQQHQQHQPLPLPLNHPLLVTSAALPFRHGHQQQPHHHNQYPHHQQQQQQQQHQHQQHQYNQQQQHHSYNQPQPQHHSQPHPQQPSVTQVQHPLLFVPTTQQQQHHQQQDQKHPQQQATAPLIETTYQNVALKLPPQQLHRNHQQLPYDHQQEHKYHQQQQQQHDQQQHQQHQQHTTVGIGGTRETSFVSTVSAKWWTPQNITTLPLGLPRGLPSSKNEAPPRPPSKGEQATDEEVQSKSLPPPYSEPDDPEYRKIKVPLCMSQQHDAPVAPLIDQHHQQEQQQHGQQAQQHGLHHGYQHQQQQHHSYQHRHRPVLVPPPLAFSGIKHADDNDGVDNDDEDDDIDAKARIAQRFSPRTITKVENETPKYLSRSFSGKGDLEKVYQQPRGHDNVIIAQRPIVTSLPGSYAVPESVERHQPTTTTPTTATGSVRYLQRDEHSDVSSSDVSTMGSDVIVQPIYSIPESTEFESCL